MTEVKTIQYAYPTSVTATKLGREQDGCYVVRTGKQTAPGRYDGTPFDTREEAIEYAEDIDLPWCPIYLHAQSLRDQ